MLLSHPAVFSDRAGLERTVRMKRARFAVGLVVVYGDFLGQNSVGVPATEGPVDFSSDDRALREFSAIRIEFRAQAVGHAIGEMLDHLKDTVGEPALGSAVGQTFAQGGT